MTTKTTTFNFGNGPVLAHRHPNGGGWVADTATVADTAYVGLDALVYGNALIFGYAQVTGNAQVSGNALVTGNARVSGNARVNKYMKLNGIMRSDRYVFIAVPDDKGIIRVIAGCRYFTFKEAEAHWKKTRGDTELGKETMSILRYMKEQVKLKGYAG